MKTRHLYEIEQLDPIPNYFLYVLQKKDYMDSSMDILAIRSDFANGIFPSYSPEIEYKRDLGCPTVQMLINVNTKFYVNIRIATVCCSLGCSRNLSEQAVMFLKDNISATCYNDIGQIRNGIEISNNAQTHHALAASINRIIGLEEATAYVQNRIST